MRRAIKKRKEFVAGSGVKTSRNRDHSQATTLIVLSVALLFTIWETLVSLDQLAFLAGFTFSADDPFDNYARKIGLLLIVFDSGANFGAYFILNGRFRQQFFMIFKSK
jgi:hypothetical protein